MNFTSSVFAIFLPLTFLLYYLPQLRNFQVYLLIFASFVFYGIYQPFQLFVLSFSFTINIICSYYSVHGHPKTRKPFLVAGILMNIGLLGLYKYTASLFEVFGGTAEDPGGFLLDLVVPAGISFQTFQGIAMLVDVTRKNERAGFYLVPTSFLLHVKQTLLFKSFFPQLIAGPITRAPSFMPQAGIKGIKEIRWEFVFRYLITGFFLKMVVADNLQEFTGWMSYPNFLKHGSLALIVMLFGYSCQIFADFAGYSLIAIGIAHLFGYSLPENFNFPYIASSVKGFWTRWHISLSTWLRDYLFLPVAWRISRYLPHERTMGVKTENIIYSISTLVTFFICGIWHGSGTGFLLWGLLFGIALIIERFIQMGMKRYLGKRLKQPVISRTRNLAGWILTFSFVSVLWLFFKLPDVDFALEYLQHMTTSHQSNDYLLIISILAFSLPVMIYHLLHLFKSTPLMNRVLPYSFLVYGMMLFMIILNSGPTGQFIYFQF